MVALVKRGRYDFSARSPPAFAPSYGIRPHVPGGCCGLRAVAAGAVSLVLKAC